MSCNHCGINFNIFHREMGCSNCGMSFCNKCLKQKCKLPSRDDGMEHSVCKSCYFKITANDGKVEECGGSAVIPPDRFFKRLANLNDDRGKAKAPIIMYKRPNNSFASESLSRGLGPADLQLLERLERLKGPKRPPPPSEDEIRSRLNKLKGVDTTDVTHITEQTMNTQGAVHVTPDTRSDQEKADALLDQLRSEANIEDPCEDDEDTAIKRITDKVQSEVSLEERCSGPFSTEEAFVKQNIQDEELPWCVLCNEDAAWRCPQCEGDLYCRDCVRGPHQELAGNGHRPIPFRPKEDGGST